jgi:hypothetical protein
MYLTVTAFEGLLLTLVQECICSNKRDNLTVRLVKDTCMTKSM